MLKGSMFIRNSISEDYLRSLGNAPHEDLQEVFMPLTLDDAAGYYREHYGITQIPF